MSILAKAKTHYQSVLAADPKPIEIEEWGGRYFVRPQISVKKKMEIQQKLTSDKMGCFTKPELTEIVRSIDPDVLIRVAGEIADMQPTADDLEKN